MSSNIHRAAISRPLYQYLVTESRGLCNLCHLRTIDEIHHIVPVEYGGQNDYTNLIPLCGSCHDKVHKSLLNRMVLTTAKRKWVRECCQVIARGLSSACSEMERMRRLLDSFDAVENVFEFNGFRDRLKELLERGTLFENLFRVHDHHINIDVDITGSCRVTEVQRWSSFITFKKRTFHIEGPAPFPTSKVGFIASARSRNHRLNTYVTLTQDHPTYKSFTVNFINEIPSYTATEVEVQYQWSNAWNIPSDRYTYDVLGWVDHVQYTMTFPEDFRVQWVHDSYIDVFGSEWHSIGTADIRENGFQWRGARLPVFSTVIIAFATTRAV